jgi:hypothetical protein
MVGGENLMRGFAFAAGSLGALSLLAASPARADDHPTLGTLALAGLVDVCVPVIERGESLAETAGAAGFLELTGENRAALGGSDGMFWWMFEFAEAVLVVGRDLSEPGTACRVAASVPVERVGQLYEELDRWAVAATPGFRELGRISESGARDTQWMWERSAGGSRQRLRLSLTRHDDGTASATLLYGLVIP